MSKSRGQMVAQLPDSSNKLKLEDYPKLTKSVHQIKDRNRRIR